MYATGFIQDIKFVTKKWAKQRRREERRASSTQRRRQSLIRSHRVTIKDAAWEVMEEAYMKASNDGSNPANARQIMHAARGHIQERTGQILDDQYFTQSLLPDYLTEYAGETEDWDVVFDDRGHLTEPHTELIVSLGTVNVRDYLNKIQAHKPDRDALNDNLLESLLDLRFPTVGPRHRFKA